MSNSTIRYDITLRHCYILIYSFLILIYKVHCQWGNWSQSECTATCGNGTRTLTRSIITEAQNLGTPCTGEKTKIEACDDLDPCPSK